MSDHPLPPPIQDALGAARTALSSYLNDEVNLTAELSEASDEVTTGRHVLVANSEAGEALFAVALDEGWAPVLSEAMQGEASAEVADLLQEVAALVYNGFVEQAEAANLAPPDATFAVADSVPALPTPVQVVTFEWAQEGEALAGCVLLAASGPHPADTASTIARASFENLGSEHISSGDGGPGNLDMLSDVELEVTVELGRRRLPLADVLRLTTGSIIELEKLVGQPLEIYANGRLIAEGEAVVIDEQFGVRVTSLASRTDPKKAHA